MQQDTEYLLEAHDISKSFLGTKVLDHVSLQVKKGEVHALLGENGAGKSTLMSIIMGIYIADEGEIYFDGSKVNINNPAQALKIGISMIYQELNPEPYMTVAQNIFLHREVLYKGTPFIDQKVLNQKTKKLLESFHFNISPTTPMSSLTVAQKQMIEVVKAVSFNCKLVIMDEPTSSLDNEETKNLFRTIRELKERGIAVIYISHRLEEIFEVADAVTVLRDGQYIATEPIGNVTRESLVTRMVGRKVSNLFPKIDVDIGETVFEVRDFNKKGVFSNINFSVRKGEILGFAGLVGSGRSEIMRAVFGLDGKDSGEIYYEGQKLNIKSPKDAIHYGITMVTEDRREYGLCLGRSIRENISLPSLREHQKGLFLNLKKEEEEVTGVSKQLSVKCTGINVAASLLSGGNQQKVVLSKWLMASPKVMILDEPTRGIDVGAKSEIHRLMCQFAEQGMAIIMISSELPEVMGMSDRLMIVSEGKIVAEVARDQIVNGEVTQEIILDKALGVN